MRLPSRKKCNKKDNKEKLWPKCVSKTSNTKVKRRKSTKKLKDGAKSATDRLRPKSSASRKKRPKKSNKSLTNGKH